MSDTASQSAWPPDIILCIVDFVVSPEDKLKIAIEPSHTITKTLLALTRTARIIYPAARRLLYTHCLYIDSARRLGLVITPLRAYFADTTTAELPVLPTQSSSPHATSLYLAPFEGYPDNYLADLHIALEVHALLFILKSSLCRFVIDIPLRNFHPIDDISGILHALYYVFTDLKSVEFLCSTRDDLFMNYDEEWRAERWGGIKIPSLWPKLKLLAVYNADLTSDIFWRDLISLESLETLVLTRSDGAQAQEVDITREWPRLSGNVNRTLTVWFVDVDGGRGIPEPVAEKREGDMVTIRIARVPTSYYGDEDVSDLCQNWIRRAALKGEEGFMAELEYLSA
jgi:hypothetical protein